MTGGLATLSPGVVLQRGLLRLSHELRIINPFKSPLPLPSGYQEGGQARPGPPWLGCLAMSWASVLLSDLCRLRTHRPLPRGMRSNCWQQRYLLASGLGCGKGAALAVLAVVIFNEVPSEDSPSNTYRPDALVWHEAVRKQKPPDTSWPNSSQLRCVLRF